MPFLKPGSKRAEGYCPISRLDQVRTTACNPRHGREVLVTIAVGQGLDQVVAQHACKRHRNASVLAGRQRQADVFQGQDELEQGGLVALLRDQDAVALVTGELKSELVSM